VDGVRTVFALVLGQLGLVTALALYFGLARTTAYLQYFGMDITVVDFSAQDYVVRSIGAAYWPLMVSTLLLVVALAVHPRILRALDPRPPIVQRRMLVATVLVGVILLGIASAGLRQLVIFPPSVPVIPLLLTAGAALLTYTWLLQHRTRARGAGSAAPQTQLAGLITLLAGALFWAWASYAAEVGKDDARNLEADLPNRPAVVVFSAHRLALSGPGLTVDEVGGQDSVYRFRYAGFRLLLRSGDRYFLIPIGWRRGEDAVVSLSETSNVRMEFIASPYR
jgi:hypothetical protein